MKKLFVNLSNTECLSYLEKGEEYKNQKPTLLFIHGALSSSAAWLDTINTLELNKYHIIAVDLRGFGNSTYNNRCHNFKDWAEDLKQFCQLKDIKKCIPIGWSFGGGIVMKFAEIAPELVSRLILTCSISHQGFFCVVNDQKCKTYQQLEQAQMIKALTPIFNQKNQKNMGQFLEPLFFRDIPNYPTQKKKVMASAALQMRCLNDAFYSMANSDIKIESIQPNILMVHGKIDILINVDTVQNTGSHCTHFVAMENRGHMVPIEDPEGYAKLLVKFIEDSI